MTMILGTLAFLLVVATEGVSLGNAKVKGGRLEVLLEHSYKQDCGRRKPVGLLAAKASKSERPGAGMDPAAIKPFTQVFKDGFFEVACVADYMFTDGDAFGDNKHDYKLGTVSNVSVVHYGAHVAKEDREQMTHEVCFAFCRTVPDMNFFGITNGRECYCSTYFKAKADDSSQCDEVCDGDKATMCGGKSKSSIFGMHACDNTAEQLSIAKGDMAQVDANIVALSAKAASIASDMQSAAEQYQVALGNAGDPGASDLMQSAKVRAGEIQKISGAANAVSGTIATLTPDAVASADLTTASALSAAEKHLEVMQETIAKGLAATEELQMVVEHAGPNGTVDASKQYYPIMYFVDKKFDSLPSTCTGTPAEKPMVGTLDACASACNSDVHECVGYSYFGSVAEGDAGSEKGLCFLISKFLTTTYYTGCSNASVPGTSPEAFMARKHKDSQQKQHHGSFLQQQASKIKANSVTCMVKFSEFEGATLKPNPSGKCDLCLKEAKKADRCF